MRSSFNQSNTDQTIYRVFQKYGTLYTPFELRVIGLTNLEIVSTKILPTFFDMGKGPRPFQRLQMVGVLIIF